jgi:IclR family pca regulon transcriptional regulator
MTETVSSDRVGSFERGLAVMEILARHPAGMTLTEMAGKAGLTRAGARRFLLTLTASGYATQTGRLFVLSPKLLAVASTWLGGDSLWGFALPFMREAAATLNEACSAGMLSDQDVIYVARVPGRRILSVALDVGTRLPAYCTSMGRVLLSGLPAQALQDFLGAATITKRTAKTITKRDTLAAAIDKARTDGFAIVDEELELGLRSIAVPIRNRAGDIVAAVNVSTQSARFSAAEMKKGMLPVLLEVQRHTESFFLP